MSSAFSRGQQIQTWMHTRIQGLQSTDAQAHPDQHPASQGWAWVHMVIAGQSRLRTTALAHVSSTEWGVVGKEDVNPTSHLLTVSWSRACECSGPSAGTFVLHSHGHSCPGKHHPSFRLSSKLTSSAKPSFLAFPQEVYQLPLHHWWHCAVPGRSWVSWQVLGATIRITGVLHRVWYILSTQ